ncbi:MAG: hypothetical protein OXT09_31105 [Myxococcales bacterium]|nr:hypothetical protein [Myxococcales bacterium]
MSGPPANRTRIPVLKIRSKCSSVDQLAVQFRKDLDPRGIFIKTKKGPPLGTRLRFEYLLDSGEAVVGGTGAVEWTRGAASQEGPAGIAVAIDDVSLGSEVLERAAEERRGTRSRFERRTGATSSAPPPRASSPAPESSMRPTAPPPEVEMAQVTLPPGQQIKSVPPPPDESTDAKPTNSEMPSELDRGIFEGVGPVEEETAREYLSDDLSDSIAMPVKPSPSSPPGPSPRPPSAMPSLPERPADWLGPLVAVLFALFVLAAAIIAIGGDNLPEPIRDLFFKK